MLKSLRNRVRQTLGRVNFRVQQDTPGTAGHFVAEHTGYDVNYRIDLPPATPSDPATVVPPRHMWLGYGGDSPEKFLSTGQSNVKEMLRIVRRDGWDLPESGARILDWGCGTGRMTRWMAMLVPNSEVWGVDLQAPLIRWASEHLSPLCNFVTITSVPHLPFEDNTFDLIAGGSVFTHIADLDDMWLLELRRVLKPGGRMWLTVLDKNSLREMQELGAAGGLGRLAQEIEDSGLVATDTNFSKLVINRSLRAMTVLHDIDHLRASWSRVLDVVTVDATLGYGHQTMVVLSKR